MKVLFAVNNDNISEAIVKKYQKDYKEIISYKNVYYFNAILKELQNNKVYDRVVISEDLEPFANNNYDTIDKFLFEKLEKIKEEATKANGSDIEVVLICADRRSQSDEMITKLFGIKIYNALIGDERNIDTLCRLMKEPRTKKEAKIAYKIETNNGMYQADDENGVSELEVQNILAHYKRLGKNEDKYVDSFNNIVSQYTDAQLRIIIRYLPLHVKAVLEEKSPKYQELSTFFVNNTREQEPYKSRTSKSVRRDVDVKMLKSEKDKISKPIVIPSELNNKNTLKIKQNEVKEETVQPKMIDMDLPNEETDIIPKRGRGRPRKNPIQEVQVDAPKRGRGRPKKEVQEKEEDFDISLFEVSNTEPPEVAEPADIKYTDDVEKNVEDLDFDLFNMEQDETHSKDDFADDLDLPNMDHEEDVDLFNMTDEEDADLFNMNDESNEEDVDLFNMNDDNDEEDVDLFNMNDENEEDDNFDLFDMDDTDEDGQIDDLDSYIEDKTKDIEYTEHNSIYDESAIDYDFVDDDVSNENPIDNVYEDENIQKDNYYVEPIIKNVTPLSSLLTNEKKIVSFVGTTKNGTSFVVNNLGLTLAEMNISTAILDMTQNKNSYYIFTNNEERLRRIAENCISNLEKGIAEGIKVNKKLTVYTEVPGTGRKYENIENILVSLMEKHDVVLIDTDFDTDVQFFEKSQEIYLVQSMDVLTIQPLTAFLRNLKTKNILRQEKIKIVINKEQRLRTLSDSLLIGGMSSYNDPSMTLMTELFNKDIVKYCKIPFEVQNYAKYLDSLASCEINLRGYTKQLLYALNDLAQTVYPLLNKNKYESKNSRKNRMEFSDATRNTLNKMKKNY